MPKLNSINIMNRSNSPLNENYTQPHPSSRSSSPKSFSVNSDHGLGSECASRLSSSKLNFFLHCSFILKIYLYLLIKTLQML